jgi:hypothetical protein
VNSARGTGSADKSTAGERLQYLSVELSDKGIAEVTDGRRDVFVPRQQIQRVELRRGIPAERPLLQVVFGIVCIVAGIVGALLVFVWVST